MKPFHLQAPIQKGQEKSGQPAAEQKVVEMIEKAGGSVRKIAQNDERLEVDFHLQAGSLTDDQLAPLKELKNIIHLHLGNTGVTDRGLAHVGNLVTLTKLHLEKTKISDAGLKHLGNLKDLSYLNLYGTEITDAGLAHLKGLTNLKNLYLWQTKMTPAGVSDLQKALPAVQINTGWEETKGTAPQDSKEKNETKGDQ